MSKILCHYTIVRYVPDLLRDEAKNIGVILFNEKDKICTSRFPDKIISHKIGAESWRQNKKMVFLYRDNLPDSREKLESWTNMQNGIIQFSEVKSLVTEDVELEMNYLLQVYVNENIQVESKPLFKTSLIKNLRQYNIIGKDKFEQDKVVNTGNSNFSHTVDLAYQNGKLHVVEAVDFTTRTFKNNIYQSSCIFQDLKKGMDKKVNTISAVKMPSDNSANSLYQLLSSTSDRLFDITDNKGQKEFVEAMKKIVN